MSQVYSYASLLNWNAWLADKARAAYANLDIRVLGKRWWHFLLPCKFHVDIPLNPTIKPYSGKTAREVYNVRTHEYDLVIGDASMRKDFMPDIIGFARFHIVSKLVDNNTEINILGFDGIGKYKEFELFLRVSFTHKSDAINFGITYK
jgi:hypothetical protein